MTRSEVDVIPRQVAGKFSRVEHQGMRGYDQVGVLNCSNRLLGWATTFMFYVLIYNAHCSFGNGTIMTVRLLKRLPRIAWKRRHLLGI